MGFTRDTKNNEKGHFRGWLTNLLEEAFYLEESSINAPEVLDYEYGNDHEQFLQQYLKPFT